MDTLLLKDAVAPRALTTRDGMLDRLFVLWFSRLVYTQIWEDPAVDLAGLDPAPGTRLAVIASGGCNILNYLSVMPLQIAAVDLNPAHVAFVRLKLAAAAHLPDAETFFRLFGGEGAGKEAGAIYRRYLAPHLDPRTRAYWEARPFGRSRLRVLAEGATRHGVLGRYLGFVHGALRLFGSHPSRLLEARTLAEQKEIFAAELAPLFDRPLLKAACNNPVVSYSLGIPPAQFAALRRDGWAGVSELYRERVRRLACDTPIQDNYFAWQAFGRRYDLDGRRAIPPYLKAESFPALRERAAAAQMYHGSMTGYLAGQPNASFAGYALLDAQDWMTPAQLTALWQEITRTSKPKARVIFRTAAAASPLEGAVDRGILGCWRPELGLARALHARDRSAIYGGFHIYTRIS